MFARVPHNGGKFPRPSFLDRPWNYVHVLYETLPNRSLTNDVFWLEIWDSLPKHLIFLKKIQYVYVKLPVGNTRTHLRSVR